MSNEEKIKSLFEAAYLLTGLTRLEIKKERGVWNPYNPERIMIIRIFISILQKDMYMEEIAKVLGYKRFTIDTYNDKKLSVTEERLKKELLEIYCKLLSKNTATITYQKNERLPDSIVWDESVEEWEIMPTIKTLDSNKFGAGYRKSLAL